MSQDFMDPELFADFIVEAKEHLETIEPNLLELEKNPDNLGLLNEIFRPMHSLKGASGFLGLNQINGLAHRAENILDELRKRQDRSDRRDHGRDPLGNRRTAHHHRQSGNPGSYEGEVETAHPLSQRIEAILAGEADLPAAEAAEPEPAETPPAPSVEDAGPAEDSTPDPQAEEAASEPGTAK